MIFNITGSSLKWAVLGQSGRSEGLKLTLQMHESVRSSIKVDDPKSGRSAKVNGPEIQKWTVLRGKTGRSFELKVDGLRPDSYYR